MNKYRHPKSSLFLMEIMINILFFVLLTTICLQLFFKAHTLSENTTVLHRAVSACTSIAEVYQSNSDGEEVILTIYPDAIALKKTLLIYYDKQFLPCKETESAYRAVLIDDESQHTVDISFYAQDEAEPLYVLSVSSYLPQTLNELTGGNPL